VATGTFTPDQEDFVSRTRFLAGDVAASGSDDFRFEDSEVMLAGRMTWLHDVFFIYQGDDDATAGTVKVSNETNGPLLALSRTMPGPTVQADSFELTPGISIAQDQIWELIRAISDLDRGWNIGIARAPRNIDWIDAGVPGYPDVLMGHKGRRVLLHRRSYDLAYTGAIPLNCLTVDRKQRIPLYEPTKAAVRLLQSWLGRPAAAASWREGKVSEAWKPEAVHQRIKDLLGLQVIGIKG
jgi:hypothetical protein